MMRFIWVLLPFANTAQITQCARCHTWMMFSELVKQFGLIFRIIEMIQILYFMIFIKQLVTVSSAGSYA
ncbi:hypothetical protein A0126_18825 (plasmid) [Exiguobacterium sp. N4-1P]|nr:hypothetical protein A0126_15145 [Exiguobacterium sp. N4-1P]ASI37643.1 hypothetical protein A0126_18825 [Exiguobacterium sp. N4-1P]